MGTGKKKIEIKLLEKGEQRMVTFSKRRQGLFKKARELHCLTGDHIASIVFSPARGGHPYVHGDPSFDATIDRYLNMISNMNSSGASATGSSSSTSSSSQVEEMINGGDHDSDGAWHWWGQWEDDDVEVLFGRGESRGLLGFEGTCSDQGEDGGHQREGCPAN